MLKWIRWWGVLVFIALIILVWLLSSVVVKPVLEFSAASILNTEVDIDDASIGWLPLGLEVSGIHVANPDDPQRHWLEADRLAVSFDTVRLFQRRWIADEMTLAGLVFNTPRSAAPIAEKNAAAAESGFSFSLPGMDLPDLDQVVDQRVADAKNELQAARDQFNEIEDRWRNQTDTLPDEDKIKGYRTRLKEAKKKSVLERVQAIKSVKDDVDDDIDTIGNLRKQLSNDIEQVNTEYREIKSLPQQQMTKALEGIGLNSGDIQLAKQLLSKYLVPFLKDLAATKKSAAEEEPAKPVRGEGEWVSFNEAEPYPKTLVKKTLLSGRLELANSPLAFSGELTDLSFQPRRWKKPARLSLSGDDDALGHFRVNGVFDHRQVKGSDRLNFSARDLMMSELSLVNSKKLNWLLNKGLANLDGDFAVKGGALSGKLSGAFEQLRFATNVNSDKKVAKILAAAINNIGAFQLDAKLAGTLSEPQLSVKSNLDLLLGSTLKEQAKAELAPYREKLRTELEAKLRGPIAALGDQRNAILDYEKLLGDRQSALSGLLKVY